eukprot:4307221-Pleurochrysis_carterae.AAC.2
MRRAASQAAPMPRCLPVRESSADAPSPTCCCATLSAAAAAAAAAAASGGGDPQHADDDDAERARLPRRVRPQGRRQPRAVRERVGARP